MEADSILITDDEPNIVSVLVVALRIHGYRVLKPGQPKQDDVIPRIIMLIYQLRKEN